MLSLFRQQIECTVHRQLTGLRPFDEVRTLSVPLEGKTPKRCSAEEAIKDIKSGEHIYLHHAASWPVDLVNAFSKHVIKNDLRGIRVSHALTFGNVPWLHEDFHDRIRSTCIFICDNVRPLVNKGKADYLPIFLSESARLYDEKAIPVDTAFLNVSPPDQHGYCSLGVNIDMSSAGARNAKRIIASINQSQPRTFGDSEIHISQIDALIDTRIPIFELPNAETSPEERQIAKWIAENLVEDGATLQMGIGSIPNNVLDQLKGHRNLGIHTEMISDGITELLERNVINNSKKSMFPGKVVSSFAMGSREFYKLLDNNPLFIFASAGFTNALSTIVQQSRMTAINSAIEVDLTGQVVSDTIGKKFYSGFGGQVDFIYGASAAIDGLGKSIIAMPSRTTKGESKIVPHIKEGAGVVTTKGHCRYMVTEHGIANLWGKTIRQRAYQLINIAHPNDREWLEEEAFKRFGFIPLRD